MLGRADVGADVAPFARPRVAFMEFRSDDDPMLTAWVRFRSPLAETASDGPVAEMHRPAPRPAAAPGTRVVAAAAPTSGFWRLLASNNRELGRSYLLYRSFDHARAHVQELQSDAAALTIAYVSGAQPGSRGWVITHAGAPVLTCSRWYDSISTRSAAASGALAALPLAVLAAAPDRSGPSGRLMRRARVEHDAAGT